MCPNGFEPFEDITGHLGDASPGLLDVLCSGTVAVLRLRPMIAGDPLFLGETELNHFKKNR
jgi:hypothetical protein